MSRKTLGRARIRINGQIFDSEPGASLKPGGIKNNTRMTSDKRYYNQTKIPAIVTCRIPVNKETSIKELQEISEAELTFTADFGTVWIIRNADQTGEVETTDGPDGGFATLTFEGDPAEEMTS